MANEKVLNARLVNKHDIEEHWLLAKNFVPMKGEIIVYDVDENYNYERFKIGDGETTIKDLPFVNEFITSEEIDAICGTIIHNANEVRL